MSAYSEEMEGKGGLSESEGLDADRREKSKSEGGIICDSGLKLSCCCTRLFVVGLWDLSGESTWETGDFN